jgi:hypothetical protein
MVVRLYKAAVVAERFHMLPTQVLTVMDEDPSEADLLAAIMLNYAAAKRDFDSPRGAKNSPWKDTPLWDSVSTTSFKLASEE